MEKVMASKDKEKRMPTLCELMSRGDLIRPDELAAGMKVSQGTVYAWVGRGLIPYLQIEKCIRFDPVDIADWLKAKRRQAAKAPGRPLDAVSGGI
jgi:hypothetical protein